MRHTIARVAPIHFYLDLQECFLEASIFLATGAKWVRSIGLKPSSSPAQPRTRIRKGVDNLVHEPHLLGEKPAPAEVHVGLQSFARAPYSVCRDTRDVFFQRKRNPEGGRLLVSVGVRGQRMGARANVDLDR